MKVPIVARVGSVSKEQGCSLGWLDMPSLNKWDTIPKSLHCCLLSLLMYFFSSSCTNPLDHFLTEFLQSLQGNHLHCTCGSLVGVVCALLWLCFQRVPFDSPELVSALLKRVVMLPCFGKASFWSRGERPDRALFLLTQKSLTTNCTKACTLWRRFKEILLGFNSVSESFELVFGPLVTLLLLPFVAIITFLWSLCSHCLLCFFGFVFLH